MNQEQNKPTDSPNIQKPKKSLKETWAKLFDYITEYKLKIAISLFFSVIFSLSGVFSPKLSGSVINLLSQGVTWSLSGGGIDFEKIFRIVFYLFLIYTGSAVASCISNYINSNISVKISYKIRKEMSDKISKLPLCYFDNVTYGEILSRVNNDVDALVSSLTQSLTKILSSVIMFVGMIYMMVTISWEMSLIAFLALPACGVVITLIFGFSRKCFREYQKKLGLINGHIEESYSAHSLIKVFNGEKLSIKKFQNLNDDMYDLSWKSEFATGFISPIMGMVSSFSYVALCVMGGYLCVTKGLTVGSIFAFLSYSNQFMSPLTSVASIPGIIQQITTATERIFEFLDQSEEPEDGENCVKILKTSEGAWWVDPQKNQKLPLEGKIEFKNIKFGYEQSKTVLSDFSLTVEPGQTVAIVGPTGVGKTTIIKLLTRFYSPTEGEIKIDEVNIQKIKRSDLNSMFGVVFQEPWLFNGSIRDNVRYGCLTATDEDIRNACKLACADNFINSLPSGYDTVIDEWSSNISYGEKQLITIARSILADHKFLILDEATSSVDTLTELRIQKALKTLLKGRTSLVIAHRLSTIKEADRIVVMKEQNICESGTHEELINKKGIYYDMYRSQFAIAE